MSVGVRLKPGKRASVPKKKPLAAMADVLSAPSLSEASDSELEVGSLCGSELELEMAWGEGPIAPLRAEAPADQGAANERAGSRGNGNGSARARTPQKRGSESPLARSKRLINIHPIRSVPYLPSPNELPVGVRKQQRWFNGAGGRNVPIGVAAVCSPPTVALQTTTSATAPRQLASRTSWSTCRLASSGGGSPTVARRLWAAD